MKKNSKNIISFFSALSLTMSLSLPSFLFLITLGFSLNLMTPTDSHATGKFACATNSTGAILTKASVSNPFALKGTTTYNQNECAVEPDVYKVNFRIVYLCKENPNVVGAAPNFSSCSTIFEGNKAVDIKPGEEAPLLDSALVIPIGSYPYGAVVTRNHYKFKHSQIFKAENGSSDVTIRGATGDGTVCWTVARTTTLINRDLSESTYDAAFLTLHGLGSTQPVEKGIFGSLSNNRAASLLDCGATAGTAAFINEIIDNFSDAIDDGTVYKDADYEYNAQWPSQGFATTEEGTGIAGVSISADLLQDDNASLATSENNAARVALYYEYKNPITISEQTAGLKLNLKTSSGVALSVNRQAGVSGANGFYGNIAVMPFTTTIQTKTRRAGRLRDWR